MTQANGDKVTVRFLIDPTRETAAAIKLWGSHCYLPKSLIEIKPVIDDETQQPVVIRMREKRYLHPKSSNRLRAAWNRDPWRKNSDGTDWSTPCPMVDITVPAWLARKNDWQHVKKAA